MTTHLLIVDDDTILVFLLRKVIEKSGRFPVPSTHPNGSHALEHLRSIYNPADRYIILLDINMPVMNGWEFLSEIRAFAKPENTIVAIVTSSTDRADKEKAADDPYVLEFLTKPVMAEALIALKDRIDAR